MSVDLNTALAIAILDTYDTHFPAGSSLEFRTAAPAGADQAAAGALLATITTPATPWDDEADIEDVLLLVGAVR